MSDDYLVRHCAPTLAGIKTGSIFTCPYESKDALLHMVRGLNKRLASKGLRILPLRLSEKKALIYIFRPKYLSKKYDTSKISQLTTRNICDRIFADVSGR